jgi:hypothetical protein
MKIDRLSLKSNIYSASFATLFEYNNTQVKTKTM